MKTNTTINGIRNYAFYTLMEYRNLYQTDNEYIYTYINNCKVKIDLLYRLCIISTACYRRTIDMWYKMLDMNIKIQWEDQP